MKEEQKRILKLVEEGIITSEETAELLDALGGAEKAKQQKEKSKEVTTHVNWDHNEQQSGNQTYDSGSTKNRFLDFVEDTIKKIKNADFDFNFGQSFDVSHIFQHQGVTFSKLEMDIANGRLDVQSWQEDDVRIECKAKVYQVESQDEARKRFMDNKQFQIDDESLSFSIPSKKIKTDIILYVPTKIYEQISLRLFNGPISVEKLQVDELKVKTANGKIQMDEVKGKEFEIDSSNGSINVEKSECDRLEVDSINGAIRLSGDFGKINTQVVNGNIHCDWKEGQGYKGAFKSTTGSIDLTLPQNVHIDGHLKTSLGSIQCDIPNFTMKEEKKEVVKKELRFDVNESHLNTLQLEADTKTGSVRIHPIK